MPNIVDQFIAHQKSTIGRIRVWSLVVTLYGDAVEPRCCLETDSEPGLLSMAVLQEITGRIGIENNALRTAMSRLASDGWLKRKRVGRASYYRPSRQALQEIVSAGDVIYKFGTDKWTGGLMFALSSKQEGFTNAEKHSLHFSDFAFRSRNFAVAPQTLNPVVCPNLKKVTYFNANAVEAGEASDFLDEMEFFIDLAPAYQQFIEAASILLDAQDKLAKISTLDALVLRALLVHHWRRIVLREAHWPNELRPDDWPGFEARAMMRKLYQLLLPASEAWLSKSEATPDGPLPKAIKNLEQRFLQ